MQFGQTQQLTSLQLDPTNPKSTKSETDNPSKVSRIVDGLDPESKIYQPPLDFNWRKCMPSSLWESVC